MREHSLCTRGVRASRDLRLAPDDRQIDLLEELVKIGAKVVSHGRYVTFQLAEVAVPRKLFREILRRIDELRPKPAPV